MSRTLCKKNGRVYDNVDRDFEIGSEANIEGRKSITIQVETSYGNYEERTIYVENKPCVIMDEKLLYSMSKIFDSNTAKCLSVYIILLSHRNRINNRCFPSIPRISELSGLSKRTINTVLTLLEENGYIIINEGKSGKANEYFFPKEWFFGYFQEDVRQTNASRPDRETRKEKHTAPKKEVNDKDKEIKDKEEQLKQKDKLIEAKDKEIEDKKKTIETLTDKCRELGDTNAKLSIKLNEQGREEKRKSNKLVVPYGYGRNAKDEDFDDDFTSVSEPSFSPFGNDDEDDEW